MNYHYGNNAFLTPQIAVAVSTIVSVTYSDLMDLLKKLTCALNTCQRHIAHIPNRAKSRSISLVCVKHTILQHL